MPDPIEMIDEDRLAILRRRLHKKLAGFAPEIPEELRQVTMAAYKPERSRFPVPELVLFALRDVLGWPSYGPGEKVRWSIHGAVDGQPVGFAQQKFGFAIFHPRDREDLRPRIEGALVHAMRDVEAFLRPFAKAQVERGEAMIINRFSEFDGRYRFFRELADEAYRRGSTPPPSAVRDGPDDAPPLPMKDISADVTMRMNAMLSASREGFYFSTAMIDSYFSCLEHRLVLLRAFTGRPFGEGEVMRLLAMPWSDKFKLILPHPLPHEASDLLGHMRRIKERIRNPFAHGGVENDQGSIFFRLPRIGAIPANFTRFGDSVRFSVLPVDSDDHAAICATFDALDAYLEAGDFSGPHEMVKYSVDPVFDADAVAEYADAIADGPEAVGAYIDTWSNRWERYVNMDY